MLATLGRHAEIRIYTLNPCREFWEDLETAGELRRRIKKEGRGGLYPSRRDVRQPELALGGEDPYGLKSDQENLALRQWGRPGRENGRLRRGATAGDCEGRSGVTVASADTRA